jgi:DNA sulfur modification protein DndC
VSNTISLFEDQRSSIEQAIELTAESLRAYGARFPHWAIAYSGGKDSSATVTVIAWLIEQNIIPRPESLTVLYADTRMELPPLQIAATSVLKALESRGIQTKVVLPALDDRFFVYMFGRGVPPPKNRFRWCTSQLKIEPMLSALSDLRDKYGRKFLMLTGVRLGESTVRDARIALSCSRDGAECGQGWFQEATPESIADTLAPLLHWRVCFVWDWLMGGVENHGFPTQAIAETYGIAEDGSSSELGARTGCVGCNLASKDTALDTVLKIERWDYLRPLKQLRPLYEELKRFKNRLQKDGYERKKDGSLTSNPGRKGPLTIEARREGLSTVLDIQAMINSEARRLDRPQISLINNEEYDRIIELIDANTWPQGWDGTEARGDVMLPRVYSSGVVQNLLID